MQQVWQSTFRHYKYERDMCHMSKTLMRLTHVQWTSSYEWYRKHADFKWSLVIDRSNIEWPTSRGLNIRLCHHGPFSLHTFHHFSLPPINRRMGEFCNSHTQGHTNTLGRKTHSCVCTVILIYLQQNLGTHTKAHTHIHNNIFTKRN